MVFPKGGFRYKKGSQMNWDVIFPIFQFMLTLAIFILLMRFVVDTASHKSFEKDYYARDIALLVDSVHASPGDVVYIYPNKIKDYDLGVELKENMVVIYDKSDNEGDG